MAEPTTFKEVLIYVLRFTNNQVDNLIDEGYDDPDKLCHWDPDDFAT